MNKIILMGLILLCFVPTVFATNGIEIIIQNENISVRGYTADPIYGKVDFGFFNKINEQINSPFSCDEIIIGNKTYQQNCTFNLDYSKDIPIFTQNESSTSIIGDTSLYQQLIDCQELKAQYSAGLDSCVEDKGKLKDVSQNFSTCTTDLQIKTSEKATADVKIKDLEEEIEANKNRQWWFGICGLIIGGVIVAYKAGMIGGPKSPESEDTSNPTQSA